MKKLVGALSMMFLAGSIFALDIDFLGAVESKLVAVDGGSFEMGSKGNENNETPVHTVNVQPFYIYNTEVTQAEYKTVMQHNFSNHKGDNYPVEEVSWYDAVIFCNKLSIGSELEPCYSLNGVTDPDEWGEVPRMNSSDSEKDAWKAIKCNFNASGYRLPTEEEWEYAATAAGKVPFVYAGSDNLGIISWNKANASEETHEVSKKIPNSLGIYDMSGNVWEWCQNWYGSYRKDITGDPSTGRKMRRGGSIKSEAVFCRNANRASSLPELRGVDLGFRFVKKSPVAVYEIVEPEVVPSSETENAAIDLSDSSVEEAAAVLEVEEPSINEDDGLETEVFVDEILDDSMSEAK